jgi:hypothetical protein
MKLLFMQSSPVSRPFLLLKSKVLSTLFSNTLNVCSSLNMRYQLHTHTKQQVVTCECSFDFFTVAVLHFKFASFSKDFLAMNKL